MMEPVDCGIRERKGRSNSEVDCFSPASTSYGSSSPSQGDGVCTPSISDCRSEHEGKWRADKHSTPRRRSNASPRNRISSDKSEDLDCGLCSPHGTNSRSEVKSYSSSQKQARKKHKGRQLLTSKVCLNQKFIEALPVEGEGSGDDDLNNSKTFELLVQRSELEEEVISLHRQLEEELELRAVLENALEQSSGTLTSFPRHLPISAQELLAEITVLEVAVLKLEEQSSTLRSDLGQAQTEREIAELKCSSKNSKHLKRQGSLLHPIFVDSDEGTDDHQTISSPVKTPGSLKSNSRGISCPSCAGENELIEFNRDPHILTCDQEPETYQLQNSWKEQRALTLRQDLRLTIPEVIDDEHLSPSPWPILQQHGVIVERYSRPLRGGPWRRNPLEEEEHWIPLNEHHPQAMFAETDQDSSEGSQVDPCLLSVGLVASHEEDPPCFSPAIIAETLVPQSPTLAEQDARSSLPVAEVLWKPASAKPLGLVEQLGKELPGMSLPATKPESWSFTSLDDHPRPESGSVPHNLNFEDQPWAQLAEDPSVDEQRTKYRIGVMKVREQRRQGVKEKLSDKLGTSETSSISLIKCGAPLSPIWSPLDTKAESEDGWDSQGDGYESPELSKSPNELSEQMVRCMIDIYRHLADPNCTAKGSSPLGSVQSPTSPFAALTNSSASSLSESSLLSITRSPLVDLRSKEELFGNEGTPDPYKARGKVPWADIGPYAHALEVPWLSVGKEQLDYAAQALRSFKVLVEQLARANPSNLKHEEKLAFWINLYNALLMHAYLAYGIPRSELKFFSLLQKAAYTVGGHSFNAATMEFCLLRSKSTAHRPQLTLLMALHKNKLTADQSKFGIDHAEPLISFALCSGTRSSPMVRVYTSKHVRSQLDDALQDYTRASVGISTKGRLLVPKILHSYARESVEDADILDWICNLLPSNQVAVVFDCMQQRRHRILGSRNFNIIPYDFSFRYLFPAVVDQKMVY